jgi:hypothetical protein
MISLFIPLYVKEVAVEEAKDTRQFADCLDTWKGRRFDTNTAYDELESLLGGEIKAKKNTPNELRLRYSTAEFLTFAYQTGDDGVEVLVQEGTIWL